MATELEIKLKKRVSELEAELEIIRQTLIICANCHDIRDKQEKWHPIADFLYEQFGIRFSHRICPKCKKELYSDLFE